MRIIRPGHSGFRIEIAGRVLLVDPWLTGNPVFPEDRRAGAIAGAAHPLISRGHGDHAGDAPARAKELEIPVAGIYDMMSHWETAHGIGVVGFNKGGTIRIGDVAVTMVTAAHSSSLAGPDGPVYAAAEAGLMIAGEGRTICFSGDTDMMADMDVFQALHRPGIGILRAGGHFTMDMKRAARAAKRYFDFRTVIPWYYRTFPPLARSAEEVKGGPPGVDVIEPGVREAIEL